MSIYQSEDMMKQEFRARKPCLCDTRQGGFTGGCGYLVMMQEIIRSKCGVTAEVDRTAPCPPIELVGRQRRSAAAPTLSDPLVPF